jgi:hypothetical protein
MVNAPAMIGSIGRRLRVVLHQPGESSSLATPETGDSPEIELVAYAEDCRLSGRLRLDSDRLSDMLNEHDEFLLEGVLAERLPEGGTLLVPELLVRRDELLLVLASGPRGDRTRRTRTLSRALALQSGPYLVSGNVHAAAGIDPLIFFRRRRPMVPLTDATIEYRAAAGPLREYAGTLVVNRDLVDWVRDADADAAPISAPDRLGRPTH